jgi:ParB/RepB/Spo0J family partition protein
MPDPTHPRDELRFVALEHIREADAFNPRDRADPDAQAELEASVRARGILVPLQLAPGDAGEGFVVVAGHRRLRAARAAGLTEVPAVVRAGDERLLDAISENRGRQDLSPIQEARAFQRALDEYGLRSHKALAERLGERPGLISDRLRLLKLPARTQAHLNHGRLPLAVVPVLLKVAKISPTLADALATGAAGGQVEPDRFAGDPAGVIERDLPRLEFPDDQPPAYAAPVGAHRVELERLLPRDGHEALFARWDALPADRWGYREPWAQLRFDDDDVDAARALGCLLELPAPDDGWHTEPARFLCDPAWVADRVAGKLDAIEAEHARRAEAETEERRAALAADGVDAAQASEEELEAAEQERRRATRQAEQAGRIALREGVRLSV